MRPVNNLNYLIHHLASVISKQSDQLLQEQLGIGWSQYRILMVLEWVPRVQQSTISKSLGQSEASVSRQLRLLRTKGLLSSQVDPANKRRHINMTTSLGIQVTDAAKDILNRNFTQELPKASQERIKMITANLKELHNSVCQPGKAGACDHQLSID
jgi:DNA-binding MarR family transcriptional regulator